MYIEQLHLFAFQKAQNEIANYRSYTNRGTISNVRPRGEHDAYAF
ncbi:MAG: hypothetical protein ACI85F_002792 [Bacteroidia bacterium]|jgi:hypothetical protein